MAAALEAASDDIDIISAHLIGTQSAVTVAICMYCGLSECLG